jgi:hypothetical protein
MVTHPKRRVLARLSVEGEQTGYTMPTLDCGSTKLTKHHSPTKKNGNKAKSQPGGEDAFASANMSQNTKRRLVVPAAICIERVSQLVRD